MKFSRKQALVLVARIKAHGEAARDASVARGTRKPGSQNRKKGFRGAKKR